MSYIEEAIRNVESVAKRFVHPKLSFRVERSRENFYKVYLQHPEVSKSGSTYLSDGHSLDFAERRLYALVNRWPDLRRCEHDAGFIRYMNRLDVCPVCWRERR